MSDLTQLLEAADQQGDRQSALDLLPPIYAELRQLKMAGEVVGRTLEATAPDR